MRGFTILEVLLVILLTSLVGIGCLGFYLEMFYVHRDLLERSELTHQLRTGLEVMVQELQEADPSTIQFQNPIEQGYGQVQFSTYGSNTIYKFYINSSKKLIRAAKQPESNWGYTTIADQIDRLLMTSSDLAMVSNPWIKIELRSALPTKYLELESVVTAGF